MRYKADLYCFLFNQFHSVTCTKRKSYDLKHCFIFLLILTCVLSLQNKVTSKVKYCNTIFKFADVKWASLCILQYFANCYINSFQRISEVVSSAISLLINCFSVNNILFRLIFSFLWRKILSKEWKYNFSWVMYVYGDSKVITVMLDTWHLHLWTAIKTWFIIYWIDRRTYQLL